MRRVSALCVLSVLLLAHGGCGTRHAGASEETNALDVIVDANELAAAFEKSADRAAELYTGKRARISGYFARVETFDDGRAAILFKTSLDTYRPLRCVNVVADLGARVAELDAGSPITVDGTIGGFTDSAYFVTVENCSVR